MSSGGLGPTIAIVLVSGSLYAYVYYLHWQFKRQKAADPKNEKGR